MVCGCDHCLFAGGRDWPQCNNAVLECFIRHFASLLVYSLHKLPGQQHSTVNSARLLQHLKPAA
jgi:hypothetical protein